MVRREEGLAMNQPKHKLCFYGRRDNGNRSHATYLATYRRLNNKREYVAPLPLRRVYLDKSGKVIKENC